MGICTTKSEDKEIGRKIQQIMEENQKKIDYLDMKCNYLQMVLFQHISYDKILQYNENFQNQYNIYYNQLDNKLYNKSDSNFKIEGQKIITVLFEVNGNTYSVITPTNAGLKEVYFIFLNKINNPLYSNINILKIFYNAINITMNFINNDRLDTVIRKTDNPKILVVL